MKTRLIALLTASILAVTLAACGDSSKQAADKAATPPADAASKDAMAPKK